MRKLVELLVEQFRNFWATGSSVSSNLRATPISASISALDCAAAAAFLGQKPQRIHPGTEEGSNARRLRGIGKLPVREQDRNRI